MSEERKFRDIPGVPGGAFLTDAEYNAAMVIIRAERAMKDNANESAERLLNSAEKIPGVLSLAQMISGRIEKRRKEKFLRNLNR